MLAPGAQKFTGGKRSQVDQNSKPTRTFKVRRRCLSRSDEIDTPLLPSLIAKTACVVKFERLIHVIACWSERRARGEADWYLQCRTGRRLIDFEFISKIVPEIVRNCYLAPKCSDWYFLKLMDDIVEYPNITEESRKVNSKLECRSKELMNVCNATEVIDGLVILAAAGKRIDAEDKAAISVDSETSDERRNLQFIWP